MTVFFYFYTSASFSFLYYFGLGTFCDCGKEQRRLYSLLSCCWNHSHVRCFLMIIWHVFTYYCLQFISPPFENLEIQRIYFVTFRDNICHIVEAPAEVSDKIKRLATSVAEKAIKSLEGAGVFAVELFLTENDEVCWISYRYFIILLEGCWHQLFDVYFLLDFIKRSGPKAS
jgi:hypothetical protein